MVVILAAGLLACTPSDPGPVPTSAAAPSSDQVAADVRLEPGDDLDAAVQAHPPGTTFVLGAGTHRGQFVQPRDGDTFVGEPGAVVSGAEVLDPQAFTPHEQGWVLEGRTEQPWLVGGELHGEMLPGFERDAANHDLWWDDRRLRHVASAEDVGEADEWYFDYERGRILVAADPASARSIELSVVTNFLRSDAADVTVRGVTVTRFANIAQVGAIEAEGPRWRISDVTVTENHGLGVGLFDAAVLEDSSITDNGQLGVGTDDGSDIVVRRSEILRNGHLGYFWAWERGGLKFKGTTGAHVHDNVVSDNRGPGIWFDLDNTDALIEGNQAIENDINGIFYEVSSDGVIRGNEVRGNGLAQDVGNLGTGIFISISHDVLVEDNDVARNYNEVIIVHADRRAELGPDVEAADVVVRDNRIVATRDGAVGLFVDTDEVEYYRSRGNVFTGNRYTFDGCTRCFLWEDGEIDLDAWMAVGNDTDAG